MANEERHDPTWKLLGNASQRIPSSSFTQNVVRSVRLEMATSQNPASRWERFFTGWRPFAFAGAAACVLAGGWLFFAPTPKDAGTFVDHTEKSTQVVAEAVAADTTPLDELSYRAELLASVENPSSLDDEDLLELVIF